jgi:erythromycin esterase-like protein
MVIVTAERYYRAMIAGPTSWNIRDRHGSYFRKSNGSDAKGIIWEHNTHIGDARATDMCDDGTVNVGQIINEEHKPEECRLWFLQGDIAGREWGDAGDAGS